MTESVAQRSFSLWSEQSHDFELRTEILSDRAQLGRRLSKAEAGGVGGKLGEWANRSEVWKKSLQLRVLGNVETTLRPPAWGASWGAPPGTWTLEWANRELCFTHPSVATGKWQCVRSRSQPSAYVKEFGEVSLFLGQWQPRNLDWVWVRLLNGLFSAGP